MAINPIAFTHKVVRGFLQYHLTAFPLADPRLDAQMRRLLSIAETRRTPLLKGPYVSLSRPFAAGAAVEDVVAEGLLHPYLRQLHPFPHLYGHQEQAIRAITAGQTTLVSTGTGSGKTECFLYPIISRCLQLRDQGAPAGIVAVIVYPMNALAEDQLGRLRALLAGSGVSFGLYVGTTPEREADVTGLRLPPASGRADYQAALAQLAAKGLPDAVHPAEELASRETMRQPGRQPRILLTNVKQLELLLTRQSDVELFDGATLDYLVFDEAHTFGGAAGAETACLIRRLRAFCGRGPADTVCIATSATLADPEVGQDAGRDFAARFFGVDPSHVTLVGEAYARDDWSPVRAVSPPPPGEPAEHLNALLAAVDAADDGQALRAAFQAMTGEALWADSDWRRDLYRRLAANELVYQLAELLAEPRPMDRLPAELEARVGRPVAEAEILAWLTLGAAARSAGRPLLRPVVHGFVRGLGGAVVGFPPEAEGPVLALGVEADEVAVADPPLRRLPLTTCTTCGQHYFIHHVQDFDFTGPEPAGGQALGDSHYWPALDETLGGQRVVLLDRLATSVGDEDEDQDEDAKPARSAVLWFCRHCGALHPAALGTCRGCERAGPLVPLLAVQQKEDHPGFLSSCLTCAAPGRPYGGRYREPARPVRAVSVADVHILAQDMVRHAERPRLLVFADNRQDAAFQAGWMRDRARRYRLRALMAETLRQGPTSVGDLSHALDDALNRDDDLSRALLPEVWAIFRKEAAGQKHVQERRHYLRIQVLRELSTGIKQRIGLEPWGRLRVDYLGLDPAAPFVSRWAHDLDLAPETLAEGIAGLLDQYRRKMVLLDREGEIFSHTWRDGDHEIQNNYLPRLPGVPKGLKLRRQPGDEPARISQWWSTHNTTARQVALKWAVPADRLEAFLTELWVFLADETQILVPTVLRGYKNRVLSGSSGAHQIDADRLSLRGHQGLWRCDRCRRSQARPAPGDACLAWRCDGSLRFEPEDPDNYDLRLLDEAPRMIRPREHSAQVPAEDRERLERWFKGETERVNTLVCTPTLELGVDIGALDSVLMRNVPPQAANYWQRVGRAGRRHRMAVNLTYARPTSHDRAYFQDPLKMLGGRVAPPRFNLRNDLMVAKHVHAAVLTRLQQLARPDSAASSPERGAITTALATAFPLAVKDYLFEPNGHVRAALPELSGLAAVIERHRDDLSGHVAAAFAQGWPAEDADIVARERLEALVSGLPTALDAVLRRLRRRLDWAMRQMQRLDAQRKEKGTLDPDEDAQYGRLDRLVKRLKGQVRPGAAEGAAGFEDSYTYGMLAVEGFLPGYGLETGAIRATAVLPRQQGRDFGLSRAPAMALREYVPGNLIYANGHRFVARTYHLAAGDDSGGEANLQWFQIDRAAEAVVAQAPAGGDAIQSLAAEVLRAVPICELDLSYRARISDDEDYRFQLPVAVYGLQEPRHGGGRVFQWSGQTVQHLRGAHFKLVNTGPALPAAEPGYPVCLVCGQCSSPLASRTERDHFAGRHLERCGQAVQPTGFYADILADALIFQDFEDREAAYSVLEALRLGATTVLDMERSDLQILVIGRAGAAQVNGILFDPMPGGSGLLDQLLSAFDQVQAAALRTVADCPATCARACVDCLLAFENGHYHRHLDRRRALAALEAGGAALVLDHDLPPKLPDPVLDPAEMPVNLAERSLAEMLDRAGFPQPLAQQAIELGRPLGATVPDFFWPGEDGEPGVCLYLDGLSRHIHGNARTQARDREIRETLRNRGYEVLCVAASDLFDRGEMRAHFRRLARYLIGRDAAKAVAADEAWYGAPGPER